MATSVSVTESADHTTSLTSTDIPITTVTTFVTSSLALGSISSSTSTVTTTAPSSTNATLSIINSHTLSSSSQFDNNNNNNSSSVGVIVVVVVVFIFITIVVVEIIVLWPRKKSEQHTKPEGVYYSTIDEITLPRSPTSKPEPVYNEMNDGQQENKEPEYMDIPEGIHSTKQTNKVTMQDNPAYSIPSEHQVEIQDNPAYSTSSGVITLMK